MTQGEDGRSVAVWMIRFLSVTPLLPSPATNHLSL